MSLSMDTHIITRVWVVNAGDQLGLSWLSDACNIMVEICKDTSIPPLELKLTHYIVDTIEFDPQEILGMGFKTAQTIIDERKDKYYRLMNLVQNHE